MMPPRPRTHDAVPSRLSDYLDFDDSFVRQVIDSAPHGVAILNSEAVILYTNPLLRDMYRASAEELLGLRFGSLIAPRDVDPDRRRAFREDPKPFMSGEVWDVSAQRLDGSEFPIGIQLTALHTPHGLLIRATVHDLTERKDEEAALRDAVAREQEATSRLRELDRLKAEFISTASHELRTPLTVVMGFARMLEGRWETLDDATRVHLVKRIAASGQRLEGLIADMIDFTRVEAGEIEVSLTDQPLDELTHEAAYRIRPLLDGHHLRVDIPTGVVVRADRAVTSRIIENLLTYAVRSSPSGTNIRVDVLDPTAADITVRVIDDGPSMDDSIENGPSSIGLTITKAFIEAQGGRMWLDRDADCGCESGGNCICFTISRHGSALA